MDLIAANQSKFINIPNIDAMTYIRGYLSAVNDCFERHSQIHSSFLQLPEQFFTLLHKPIEDGGLNVLTSFPDMLVNFCKEY